MSEHASRGRRRVFHDGRRAAKIGDNAVRFARWYTKSKFALMRGFLGELQCDPADRDAADLERRFLRCTRHARHVLAARGGVTLLLALGVLATAAATVARVVVFPGSLQGDITGWVSVLDRAAAVAGSVTLVLLVARLAFDRYLERVEVSATFLAMQLAATPARPTGRSS